MAIFRKIHVSFWDDPFIETLTPEEKYFYLFLMTNPKVTECGIYEITKKKMRDWSGYNEETIEKLLQRFIDYKKVVYSETTKEIALINKPKFINRLGKPVIDCIESELKQVKDNSLIQILSGNCKNDQIKNIYDTYNDTSTMRRQEEEEEKEKEKEEEKVGESHRLLWINIFRFNPGMVEVDFCERLIIKFGNNRAKTILYNLRKDNFHSIRTMEEALDEDGNIKPRDRSNFKAEGISETTPAANKLLI
jgi:hypothetical protein